MGIPRHLPLRPNIGTERIGLPRVCNTKRTQFIPMRAIVLFVNIPKKWLACPNRAHKTVLTAHRVDVRAPQQLVVLGLTEHGQKHRTQIALRVSPIFRRCIAQLRPCVLKRNLRFARCHRELYRWFAPHQSGQPLHQRQMLITKHTDF